MEIQQAKCSFKNHKERNAITYCEQCEIYMCKDCATYHKGLLEKHNSFTLDKNIKEIFTGFCKEERHTNELEYFCKTHNQLCCIACITKIKGEGKGQHTDCEVCFLKEVKDEKRNRLKENIYYLESSSNSYKNTVNELKLINEKVNKSKEELKINIQKLFTKIRNTINKREDQLLLKVNKLYENLYHNKEVIEDNENFQNEIKISLEKGKLVEQNWENDNIKLNSLINDCIIIENNIKKIHLINENIKKYNINKYMKIYFIPEEDEIYQFLEKIKNFGDINYNDFKYQLKRCPFNINENRKYIITGEKNNIFTKIGGSNQFIAAICEAQLERSIINKWKVNILKSKNKIIMVGVTTNDIVINSSSYNTCGWYFYCYNSTLYSGKPHNYNNKKTNLNIINESIEIIMDMNKGSLKFIIDSEDKGESYNNIPLDKPLIPVFLLYDKNDSIEVIEC